MVRVKDYDAGISKNNDRDVDHLHWGFNLVSL